MWFGAGGKEEHKREAAAVQARLGRDAMGLEGPD